MAKAFPLLAIDTDGSLAASAPLMLHTRLVELYRFAKSVDDVALVDDLHNMRIAAKRLRYTMEIFEPCLSGGAFDDLYKAVKSIQEQIGDIHDCDVRRPFIAEFLNAEADRRPEIRVGLERAIAAETATRNRLYLRLRRYWKKLESQGFHDQFLQMLVRSEETAVR